MLNINVTIANLVRQRAFLYLTYSRSLNPKGLKEVDDGSKTQLEIFFR